MVGAPGLHPSLDQGPPPRRSVGCLFRSLLHLAALRPAVLAHSGSLFIPSTPPQAIIALASFPPSCATPSERTKSPVYFVRDTLSASLCLPGVGSSPPLSLPDRSASWSPVSAVSTFPAASPESHRVLVPSVCLPRRHREASRPQTCSMKETSPDPPDIGPRRTSAQPKAYGVSSPSATRSHGPSPSVTESPPNGTTLVGNSSFAALGHLTPPSCHHAHAHNGNAARPADGGGPSSPSILDSTQHISLAPASLGFLSSPNGQLMSPASPQDQGPRPDLESKDGGFPADETLPNERRGPSRMRSVLDEAKRSFWLVATYSWLNILLVFVPIGIIVGNIGGINGGIVFSMNCVAVVPLAGLLAYATEAVASKMGDALGALLNVTFGNAVELIIFIIALAQNKIRIVQASLLGSILANLLLILGMGFFLGGMRFREQIYNSTVTQMSACLLSLSVISLVLPTAFYESFQDQSLAESESLKISRGTSVILLLVYVVYLLFQLKSHAYLYESTPQHIVDAESTPGPAASWLESSSDSDATTASDSDSSGHSLDTVRRRMKKVLRAGRRRKSSTASVETSDVNFTRTSSFGTVNTNPLDEGVSEASSRRPHASPHILNDAGDPYEEALEDEKPSRSSRKHRFQRRKHRRSKKKELQRETDGGHIQATISERSEYVADMGQDGETRRVDFAVQMDDPAGAESGTDGRPGGARLPFPALRGMSVKNLAPSVFTQKPDAGSAAAPAGAAGQVPRVRYGIRRTNSLPDRLNYQPPVRPPGAILPARIPLTAVSNAPVMTGAKGGGEDEEDRLSRSASMILLLIVTALVAVCAEFLISSIEEVTQTSSVGEIFIGLIILPIVGNAAEHVTALTVAMKNKMDLAIGVAVGSSIQIAIFVTPLIVILGWIMERDMTLHFTLFETVCLFVSAFMVNFLVLDGRSNYLEGALLCAVYFIIAVVAFFYPDPKQAARP